MATYTHIYKFPVANCSRHGSCTACLGSRDPHCYWNTINGMCEKNDIGTVDVEGSFAFDTRYVIQFSGYNNSIQMITWLYLR